MNDNHRALIITVNFRQTACTLRFLNSASQLEGFSQSRLLIVDNNSGDGSTSRLRTPIAAFGNVELLPYSENFGYFGGAKRALDDFLTDHRLPQWVIVCNNDIVFDDPEFLTRLLASDAQAGAVLAPAVT